MDFPHNKKGVDEVCSLQAAQGVLVWRYEPLQTKQGTKVLLFYTVCTWCDPSLALSPIRGQCFLGNKVCTKFLSCERSLLISFDFTPVLY